MVQRTDQAQVQTVRGDTPGAGGAALSAAVCLFMLLFVWGCDNAPPAPFDLPIYFTCDTHGRLAPCGCFTGQFGGLTRLKTVLDAEAPTNSVRVDVGDAIGGPQDFDLIEYDYLLRAYASMKFDALNLGHREAALSAARLRELKTKSPVPLLSANLLDKATGAPIFEGWRMVQRGACRIAIVGVVDPRGLHDTLGEGLVVEKMESALSRLLPQVRRQADVVILLAFTDEATLAKLAQEFYELDVILGGKVSQPAQKLEKENRSLISFVTNESRALGWLRLRIGHRAPVEVLGHEIRLLHDKIPQDKSVQALVRAYREQIRATRLRVDAPERLQEDMVPGVRTVATFVGTEACLECHRSAAQVWQKSSHARAFRTLLENQADADPKCIGCHTIGFASPSGYRRQFTGSKLAEVGCESCHGPGSVHVRQHRGEAGVSFTFRPLGAGDCQKCHHGEFSRPFDWDQFWPLVRHTKEPKATAVTSPQRAPTGRPGN